MYGVPTKTKNPIFPIQREIRIPGKCQTLFTFAKLDTRVYKDINLLRPICRNERAQRQQKIQREDAEFYSRFEFLHFCIRSLARSLLSSFTFPDTGII